MGFGCNVPSILGTRVIRDPAQRLLTMLVIPFSLCQARLTVFVFMAGVFFPRPWWAAGLVVFGFYLMCFVAAIITGLAFKRVFCQPTSKTAPLPTPKSEPPPMRFVALFPGWFRLGCAGGASACSWFSWLVALVVFCR
jgi:ferrous iron transport protein B